MAGTFDGEFVGPVRLFSAGLAVCGMPGWHGKRFDTAERGINRLVGREGFPMYAELGASWADGRTAIVATYGDRERLPFRRIRDEFRAWDDRTLLGLSFLDAPGARKLGAPFLLHRVG